MLADKAARNRRRSGLNICYGKQVSGDINGSGNRGEVKAQGRTIGAHLYTASAALELHRTIHDFASLSRFITESRTGDKMLGLKMDSQSRVFEAPVETTAIAGTPLRCPRHMTTQVLMPWTPGRILVAMASTLISVPAQLAPAVLNRRRA